MFSFLIKRLSDGANGEPRSFQEERAHNYGSGGGPKTSVRVFADLIRVGLKLQKINVTSGVQRRTAAGVVFPGCGRFGDTAARMVFPERRGP